MTCLARHCLQSALKSLIKGPRTIYFRLALSWRYGPSESSVQSTEVALWEIPEETYDVISADHEAIGKWAELKITKESLVATTEEQFERFCHDRVEESGYNWYTIACSDGTGIQFNGCFTGAATYGIIDKDGCIEDVLGYITLGDDGYEYSDAAE